jgi:hypothetical protein
MLLRLVGNLTLLFIDYAANCLTNDSAAIIFSVKGDCGWRIDPVHYVLCGEN